MAIVGRLLMRYTVNRPRLLLIMLMVAAATLSAFISNTACTAFFLPVAVAVAASTKTSPSKLLMPLAFCSILSSSVTLISTSSNLVVSGLMTTAGLAPMRMFELTPVGVPITVAGLLYIFLIGRRMIPNRTPPTPMLERFGVGPYLSEILIQEGSPLVGRSLEEAGFARKLDLNVLRVVRVTGEHLIPPPNLRLQAGDVILVEGATQDILRIKETKGISIKSDVQLSDPNLESADTALLEVILLPGSNLIGRTLKEVGFSDRYGLHVLAMNRSGENVIQQINEVPLRMGDVLLIQGDKRNIAALSDDRAFRVLGIVEGSPVEMRKALLTVAICFLSFGLGVAEIVPLPIAVLLGAFAAFVTRCITPEDAYRQVDWRTIVLIACMLSLGVAMERTGTAHFLAGLIVRYGSAYGPLFLLGSFFVLTVLLTQPMSNQAAAAVILPIAIRTANELGENPRTFAMMVAVAASCSYLTPLEPSCLMVYGPGRYRFTDFLKVGSPLTVIIFAIAMLLVPRVWPLR
jgi:di/tricarboxylate transporter